MNALQLDQLAGEVKNWLGNFSFRQSIKFFHSYVVLVNNDNNNGNISGNNDDNNNENNNDNNNKQQQYQWQ